MGIALQNGTVHERARIAFVGVAAHIFLVGLVAGGQAPLHTGGEAGASAAAEAGILDHLDDLLGSHLGQNLAQRGVAVLGYVLVDVLRVDDAAVPQGDSSLLCVEGRLVQGFDGVILLHGLLIQQALDDSSLQQMLFHDLRNVLYLHHAVEGALRIYDHNRAQGAQAEAAGADHVDFVFQAPGLDFFFHLLNDFFTV